MRLSNAKQRQECFEMYLNFLYSAWPSANNRTRLVHWFGNASSKKTEGVKEGSSYSGW